MDKEITSHFQTAPAFLHILTSSDWILPFQNILISSFFVDESALVFI